MAYLRLVTGSKGVRAVIRSEKNVILNSQLFPTDTGGYPSVNLVTTRYKAKLWARPLIATYNLLEGCT